MSFGRGMKIEFKICIFSPCFKAEEGEKNCKVELETEKGFWKSLEDVLLKSLNFPANSRKPHPYSNKRKVIGEKKLANWYNLLIR